MLEYLLGEVISCNGGILVLQVNNIAFQLRVSQATEISCKRGDQCKIFTHLTIREDMVKLFGFAGIEERLLFLKLQSISGVGPAMALSILSGGAPEALRKAILNEDLGFFKRIKGVGPKTAKRIILELKGTIQNIPIGGESGQDTTNKICQDAVLALAALGYQQASASEIVEKVFQDMGEDATVDRVILESLKIMRS